MELFVYIIIIIVSLQMSKCENNYFAPSIFVNHGGGPNPVLGEQNNLEIGESMRNVTKFVDLKRLKAFIVVTAHREEDIVTISSGENHDLLYDYNNFPPESYKLKYKAPGDPILAQRINDAFKNAGITSKLDSVRGWDHGVFIPMMLINPSADIPVIQISILKSQNAEQHYEIGKVLHQFRKEGIVIIGSGMSYHNMEAFKKVLGGYQNDTVIVNEQFDDFLKYVCTGNLEVREGILKWNEVSQGLESHPLNKADHLMPLIVTAGAAGPGPGRKTFDSVFLKKFKLSNFIWDD